MTITEFIKESLKAHGLTFAAYARELNIRRQSLNGKAKKDNYSILDLVIFGKMVGLKLVIMNKEKTVITIIAEENAPQYRVNELSEFANILGLIVSIVSTDERPAMMLSVSKDKSLSLLLA